jgi:hypothetical protein
MNLAIAADAPHPNHKLSTRLRMSSHGWAESGRLPVISLEVLARNARRNGQQTLARYSRVATGAPDPSEGVRDHDYYDHSQAVETFLCRDVWETIVCRVVL